jgi:hypothetical protein
MAKTQITTDRIKDFTEGGGTGYGNTFYAAVYPFDNAYRKITRFNNTVFVSFSTSPNNSRTLRSDDGKHFYYCADTAGIVPYAIHINTRGTLLVGDRTNGVNSIKRSTDFGISYENIISPITTEITGIASSGIRWVACSRVGTGNRAIYSTDDGITFLASVTHEDTSFESVLFFERRVWIVASSGTQRLGVSVNGGANFTGITVPNRFYTKLSKHKNKLILIAGGTGSTSRLIWTSDLGVTTNASLLPADVGRDTTLVIGDGRQIGEYFYVCGNEGLIARTLNFTSWEVITTGVTNTFTDIDYIILDNIHHIIAIASDGTENRIITTVV